MPYLLPSVTATVHPAAEREDTETINGKTIHLLAYGWSTRRSWGHTAYCPELGLSNKIRYYNRTWEAHRFDSVIHGLLYKCRIQLDGDFRKAENKAVRERRKARREAAKREAEERQQVLNLGI